MTFVNARPLTRRRTKTCVFAMAALLVPAIYADDNKPDGIPPDATGGTLQRGVSDDNLPHHGAKHGGGGSGNLIDHGGPVLATSKTYYIWWGNQNVWPTDANSGLTSLAQGFNNSTFLNDIFPQYMHGSSVTTSFVESLYDATSPPNRGPSVSTIVNEACQVIGANHLTPDSSAVYVVLTANFPAHVNYCAWHSYGTCNGKTIQVAYMPNTTGVAGCNDPVFTCNQLTQGTNGIANVLSHEFSETITDPNQNAWYDSSGSEIGDKCAWTFSQCVNLTNGSWQLQREWSNKISGCAQQ